MAANTRTFWRCNVAALTSAALFSCAGFSLRTAGAAEADPAVAAVSIDPSPAAAEVRHGKIDFKPAATEADVPERFQLSAAQFDYTLTPVATVSRTFRIAELTFPSPVVTEEPANNTVHCEYFLPRSAGKHPGVIVLHILGGDFDLARLFARSLAQNGVASLFVKMPYYGPRRTPGAPGRMVSRDPQETVRGMTQAIQDIRRAAAWLAEQEEVDPDRLGIMGISLGGITSALAASAEPRFQNICLILAGGGIGAVAWEAPELRPLRERWIASGGTKESLSKLLAEVDPVTYAKNARGRRILMLNASRDEVIPKANTIALWEALGKPPIIWWDAGHYSAGRYVFDGLAKATTFFRDAPAKRPE